MPRHSERPESIHRKPELFGNWLWWKQSSREKGRKSEMKGKYGIDFCHNEKVNECNDATGKCLTSFL